MSWTSNVRSGFAMVEQMELDEIRRGRSVVCSLHVHLVFASKYRRGVFSERALEVLRDAFLGVCTHYDCSNLVEMNGSDDHVRLLIEYPPTGRLDRLVGTLKGVSSRRLRQEKFPEVTEKLWDGHLWSPSISRPPAAERRSTSSRTTSKTKGGLTRS
jgi:putative transposase